MCFGQESQKEPGYGIFHVKTGTPRRGRAEHEPDHTSNTNGRHRLSARTRFFQTGNTTESCSNGLAQAIRNVHDRWSCTIVAIEVFHKLMMLAVT